MADALDTLPAARRALLTTLKRAGEARADELADALHVTGYLADAEPGPDGSWRIVEHNCAILAVATKYGAACGTELEFIREVLPSATVERVAHLLSGGHVCAYEITPRLTPVPSRRR